MAKPESKDRQGVVHGVFLPEPWADLILPLPGMRSRPQRTSDIKMNARKRALQVCHYQILLVAISLLAGEQDVSGGEDELFVARPLTADNVFTPGIEGPACDADGTIYAVNFAEQGTIGKISPTGEAAVAFRLPGNSVGNGIRFDSQGAMFVADYVNHNVFRGDPDSGELRVFAHHDEMNQPNDLTIAADGTLYASDPAWNEGTGQIWRIDCNGEVRRVAADMGTTNGIELSPDGQTIFVNESVQRNIWSFAVEENGDLSNKQLVRKFDGHGFDGMRCDVDGNLYVTRHGKGTVVKITPGGEMLREIDVLGTKPTNICFGGPDGRTAYVTEVDHCRIVSFRVDRPGLSWQRWQSE